MLLASTTDKPRGGAHGFSLLELVLVLASVVILSSFAVYGFNAARASSRLQSSTRQFASRLEKARLDAIRRHDSANVEFVNSTTYEITMDFTGRGNTPQTRSFTLESDVVLTDSNGATMAAGPYPYADFDWRGRTAECSMLFRFKNRRNDSSTIQVAGSGDITVNNSITTLPTISYANVNGTNDVATDSVVIGTDTRLNVAPCGTTTPSGAGTTVIPPTTGCPGWTFSTTYVSDLKKNGGNTRTVTITVNGPGTVTAVPDPNLSVTPATRTVLSNTGETITFTVASATRSRSTFPVKFSYSSCSQQTVYFKVIN